MYDCAHDYGYQCLAGIAIIVPAEKAALSCNVVYCYQFYLMVQDLGLSPE